MFWKVQKRKEKKRNQQKVYLLTVGKIRKKETLKERKARQRKTIKPSEVIKEKFNPFLNRSSLYNSSVICIP